MRYAIVLVVLALSGCGFYDRYVTANVTGFARSCVEGVTYYQFPSGVTVAYDQQGRVRPCQ